MTSEEDSTNDIEYLRSFIKELKATNRRMNSELQQAYTSLNLYIQDEGNRPVRCQLNDGKWPCEPSSEMEQLSHELDGFKHAPVRADVVVLQKTGIWPNGEVPAWAEERAEAWDCSEACSTIQMAAATSEIKRLNGEIAVFISECRQRLQFDHGGPEKIDELEDTTMYLRAQVDRLTSERDAAVAKLERMTRLFDRSLSIGHNAFCSCGGAGPGEGCAVCDAYHATRAAFTEEDED